ncbi:MAG: CinA family protein [Actinomycetota bacterium]
MSAEEVLDILRSKNLKLVLAESLTGGLLSYRFASVPGASDSLLGAVVAYDTELKHSLLGVSAALLENQGAVDPEVAAQMASQLRIKIATLKNLPIEQLVAIATTGVAGPTEQAGKGIGEVYIAIDRGGDGSSSTNVYAHQLKGDRSEIQEAVVLLALSHLQEEIAG